MPGVALCAGDMSLAGIDAAGRRDGNAVGRGRWNEVLTCEQPLSS